MLQLLSFLPVLLENSFLLAIFVQLCETKLLKSLFSFSFVVVKLHFSIIAFSALTPLVGLQERKFVKKIHSSKPQHFCFWVPA